ncbi:unnamed protein product [Ilex paraguariensis]|uniref:Uncharacterized protein n=1 Tax=Ilex paraguariensis TaxID=185542 RepID=A0ABC8RMV5_9AQUA
MVVFPKGSPLVADVSRAIVSLIKNVKILQLERQWLKNPPCIVSGISSSGLTLNSFEGLFAISGVIAMCLVIFLVIYLYKNKDFLQRISSSSTNTWSRILELCRHFDKKDLTSYPFRMNRGTQDQFQEVNDVGVSSELSDSPNLPIHSHSINRIVPLPEEEEERGADRICPIPVSEAEEEEEEEERDELEINIVSNPLYIAATTTTCG